MSQKMGFWGIFALVAGSQIGSSIFTSSALLASYGIYGIIGWVIAGSGALLLSWVFASLCARFPKTGGPHWYIDHVFGKTAAFFVGWTYWVVSWVSTTAVLFAIVGYISPLLPVQGPMVYLSLELTILAIVTYINIRGIAVAGALELALTAFKFIWLIAIPLLAMLYFDFNNISTSPTVACLPLSTILGQVTLYTFWGFIGLECGTVPADSVINSSYTIPRAIIFGTSAVALLYILNSIGIMGLIPGPILMQSQAPYTVAAQLIFGGNWHIIISIIAAILVTGTLNAWILTSGQIALGLATDTFMPPLFAKINSYGAPAWSLIISSAGIVPLLCLMMNNNLLDQLQAIIDISVISFVCIYAACSLALFTILIREKKQFCYLLPSLLAFGFCLWILSKTSLQSLAIASVFTLSGLPVYLFWYRKKSTINKK